MKKLLIVFVSLIMASALNAQHYQPVRVDVEVKKDWQNFTTLPCGDKGLIVYHSVDARKGMLNWHISYFDVEMEEVWTEVVTVPEYLLFLDKYYDEQTGKAYIVFGDGKENRGKKLIDFDDDVMINIITINPEKSERKEERVNLVRHIIAPGNLNYYKSMIAYGNKLYLFLEEAEINLISKCCSPVVLFSHLKKKTNNFIFALDTDKSNNSQVVKLSFKGKGIGFLSAFPGQNGNILYLADIRKPEDSKRNKHMLYVIDHQTGKVKEERWLNKDTEREMDYPGVIKHGENRLIYIGMYGEDDRRVQSGIVLNYYTDLEHDMQKRYSMKELTGADNRFKGMLGLFTVKQKTFMRFHPVTYDLADGSYLLVGEQIAPYFETYTYYSNGQMHTQSVHVGWSYLTAYLMAFNDEDELIWNESFDMGGKVYHDLRMIPRLTVHQTDRDQLMIMFAFGESIMSKTIHEDEPPQEQEEYKLQSQFKSSRIKGQYSTHVEYWYGDYFLASGYVSVKKNDSFLSGRDRIFYFTKLKHDD